MEANLNEKAECTVIIRAAHDAMDVLNGKWKIPIIAVLCFSKKRYSELLNEIKGISGKMLSKELKDMELNLLLKRTVLSTQPITVQYELTEYGERLKVAIEQLAIWGTAYRKEISAK
ncbi:HxlR family transcriptional regulator [Flavobacterium sp. 1]|uniref:winged helix-turn-helix transcriptional regulator n=1 Tax=Flavobacterium sp. 1 TaxID=2035200 RepID=UPI000C23CCC2|nr:helix-turn-helix domain-containing protein [Flavobacterium sp. 1]PJJ08364.1 HxlR family transcriptional regulator [Flavobacterium sp. 1]